MQKLDKYTLIGKTFLSKEGCPVKVIDVINCKQIVVEFEKGHRLNLQLGIMRRSGFTNPYYPVVEGVGYMGIGKYKSNYKIKNIRVYSAWSNTITRCYQKVKTKRNKSYIGCAVDDRWHNFQNFGKWFEENYVEGWQLDKDILIKGNKIYSPETCCFVPSEINKLFVKRKNSRGKYPIGVSSKGKKFRATLGRNGIWKNLGTFDTIEEAFECYKFHKEIEIKRVADEWKPLIEPEVYQAMYNYQVEITD